MSARQLRFAGLALATIFIISAAAQLRPLYWDTYQVSESLEQFNRLRKLFMTTGWLRALMLFPLVFVGLGVRAALPLEARAALGSTFLSAAGVLYGAAGLVGVVIGVPAEDYRLGEPEARAVEVVADSLFWIQDNLVNLANLAIGFGVLCFSLSMRRLLPLARRAGFAMLPVAALAALSFYFMDPRGPGWGASGPIHLVATWALTVTFLTWLVGAVRFLEPERETAGAPPGCCSTTRGTTTPP